MSLEVKIPSVGESITSGMISIWHKNEGDAVAKGDALFTLETDKVSSEVGADKPSSKIFSAALARTGIRASEALHVGDEPEADWLGAERAGLRAFRLQRPENSLRGVLDLIKYSGGSATK